jgi:hypothetical protein
VTLSVVVERARNLPKMDVFTGVDLFCVIFMEGTTEVFQTEVRRGKSERDWQWDPALSSAFKWNLPVGSELLNPDQALIILLYDKDQLSKDDLIGCVTVTVGELKGGVFDSWKKVVRPANAPKKQFLFYNVPEGELKLRVSLTQKPQPTSEDADTDAVPESVSEEILTAQNLDEGKSAFTSRRERTGRAHERESFALAGKRVSHAESGAFSVSSSLVYPIFKDCPPGLVAHRDEGASSDDEYWDMPKPLGVQGAGASTPTPTPFSPLRQSRSRSSEESAGLLPDSIRAPGIPPSATNVRVPNPGAGDPLAPPQSLSAESPRAGEAWSPPPSQLRPLGNPSADPPAW